MLVGISSNHLVPYKIRKEVHIFYISKFIPYLFLLPFLFLSFIIIFSTAGNFVNFVQINEICLYLHPFSSTAWTGVGRGLNRCVGVEAWTVGVAWTVLQQGWSFLHSTFRPTGEGEGEAGRGTTRKWGGGRWGGGGEGYVLPLWREPKRTVILICRGSAL
jgi:hypothetical protein